MRGDFGLHFGTWLLISATFFLLVFGFSLKPATEPYTGNPASTFFFGLTGILLFSFICSVMDYFILPAILRLFRGRRRRTLS